MLVLYQRRSGTIEYDRNIFEVRPAKSSLEAARDRHGAYGPAQETSFKQMAMLVVNEVARNSQLDHYLTALKKTQLTPELIVKSAVFIHIFIQEKGPSQADKVLDFLGEMMSTCSTLSEKYSADEPKDNISRSGRSRSYSSRSEEVFVVKEVSLLSAVARPYLGYLMRIVSTKEDLRQRSSKQPCLEKHQAWKTINLLRMVTSVTSKFTMIGRYYMNSYGSLVVLLTYALSRDIYPLVDSLGKYFRSLKPELTSPEQLLSEEALFELVDMLEEIAKLNQKLMGAYLGKYFFQRVCSLVEPPWVKTSCQEFDAVLSSKKRLRRRVRVRRKRISWFEGKLRR